MPHLTDAEVAIDVMIGEWIRNARVRLGFSQTALGEAVGVTFQQVQKYERGKNRIAVHRFLMFCEALGQDPADVITGILERRDGEGEQAPPSRRRMELAKFLDNLPDDQLEIAGHHLRSIIRIVERIKRQEADQRSR